MFEKVKTYAARGAVAGLTLGATGLALAEEPADLGTQITEQVTGAMTAGAAIAGAVVMGLFAIWAIKLLWRAR